MLMDRQTAPDGSMPQVVIENAYEAYATFLARPDPMERDRLFHRIATVGERALLWGQATKLVITSVPAAHLAALSEHLGYGGVVHICPQAPSAHICLDILREPQLWQRLVDWADPINGLELIAYAATPEFFQLVAALEAFGIAVWLPESPVPQFQWLVQYGSSKVGYRTLASRCFSPRQVPEGYVAASNAEAGAIAHWFLSQSRPCLVKPNRGFLGIGHTQFQPQSQSLSQLQQQLALNPYLADDLQVVEAYIPSNPIQSPSVEVCIPPVGSPDILMVCAQRFVGMGRYGGEVVSRSWQRADWYPTLLESAHIMACELQRMGYVGRFDLDGLVGQDGQLYWVETNLRRTGGSHLHDFACHLFGADYLNQISLLSRTQVTTRPIAPAQFEAWMQAIAPFLYSMHTASPQGIVLTHTGCLAQGQVGYVAIAPTLDAVIQCDRQFERYLAQLGVEGG